MQQITGGGAFTRTNIQQINQNFDAVASPDLWVKPQGPNASNTNPGTFESPLASMSGTNRYLKPGMTVGLLGVLFECWTPPIVNDITIVGMANTPRQATDSGIPNGGGATWLNATHTTSATAASLVTVGGSLTATAVSQGWTFRNLFFNNSSTDSTTGCIDLLRSSTGADASHASILGCKLQGGNYGIIDNGGNGRVTVDSCEFANFAGSGDTCLKTGVASVVAIPIEWTISNNKFFNCANCITLALSSGAIYNNLFGWIGSSITTTTWIVMTGGKNNAIWNNKFQVASDAAGIAAAVVLGTADSMGPSFYSDVTEYGDPTS